MMACDFASPECVSILVEFGASIFSTDAVLSQSPLHYVCAGAGKGGERYKIVQYLVDRGADTSVRDSVSDHNFIN